MHNIPHTLEIRAKISASKKGCRSSYGMLGKKVSEETKLKMSLAQKKVNNKPPIPLLGKEHWNYKGGYERKLWLNNQRRVRKLNNGGSHTLKEWEELKKHWNYTCCICRKKKILTRDHIIPLSKGGTDNISNIQPLCRSCNSKKHNKII